MMMTREEQIREKKKIIKKIIKVLFSSFSAEDETADEFIDIIYSHLIAMRREIKEIILKREYEEKQKNKQTSSA